MSYRKTKRGGCLENIIFLITFIVVIAFAIAGTLCVWLIILALKLMRFVLKKIWYWMKSIHYNAGNHQSGQSFQQKAVRISLPEKDLNNNESWDEIEYRAMERNAELKYQDMEDNYKHYLDLYK